MGIADRALAQVRGAGRTRLYGFFARSFWRMALPYTDVERAHWKRSVDEAYELHVRVLQRPGMTAEKLDQILARQMPDAEKRARADFIVDTGGTIAETEAQVDKIVEALKGREGTAFVTAWA